MVFKKWEQAVNLYRDGMLTGVNTMKVSTAGGYSWISSMPENFKNSNNFIHVIIFHCGPSDQRELMIDIGRNLLQLIEYKGSSC